MTAPLRTLALTCAVAVAVAACKKPEQPTPPPPEVGVIDAKPQTLPLQRELVGRLSPFRSADVRARVPGVLLKRVYQEGSEVKQGQTLFLIDPAPLRASLNASEAQLASARATYANAKVAADRARSLAPQQFVSKSDLDNAESAERTALAAVKQHGLTLVGLHMHIGSGVDYAHLQEVCHAMVQLVKRATDVGGIDLQAISAGGGLSIPYREGEPRIDTAHYFSLWDDARRSIAAHLGHAVHLELEPGRFLVAEAGVLVTEVRATKPMGSNRFTLVDAGFSDLMRPSMYGAFHGMGLIPADDTPRPTVETVVAGPLCECMLASASGSAVEQKAHSADMRPMIQWVRPQPGQAVTIGVNARRPMVCSNSCATITSCVRGAPGSGVSEMRIVSPMPSCISTASAALEATMPLLPMPASVRPRCSGKSERAARSRYTAISSCTPLTLAESTMRSRARRSTSRYSLAESWLKSACRRRCRSLAVMAASKSIFSSSRGGGALLAARTGANASLTRGRRLAGSALDSALGSICASSFCATLGLRKYASNNSRKIKRSCSRLTSTASSAALKSSRRRPTSITACWASAMRAASTRTPARRKVRPKPLRLSASLPVRASPSWEIVMPSATATPSYGFAFDQSEPFGLSLSKPCAALRQACMV